MGRPTACGGALAGWGGMGTAMACSDGKRRGACRPRSRRGAGGGLTAMSSAFSASTGRGSTVGAGGEATTGLRRMVAGSGGALRRDWTSDRPIATPAASKAKLSVSPTAMRRPRGGRAAGLGGIALSTIVISSPGTAIDVLVVRSESTPSSGSGVTAENSPLARSEPGKPCWIMVRESARAWLKMRHMRSPSRRV